MSRGRSGSRPDDGEGDRIPECRACGRSTPGRGGEGADDPGKGSSGGRRALEQASATENVGYAVPGHAEERQLKGGALGECGAA